MFDLFEPLSGFTIEGLKVKHPEYVREVEQYCSYLIENRFVLPAVAKGVKMPLRFETANTFSNGIIDVNKEFRSIYKYLFQETSTLRVPHLCLRLGYEMTNDDFFDMIEVFRHKELLSLEIQLNYSQKLNADDLQTRLFDTFPVSSLYVFGHPFEMIRPNSPVYYLRESFDTCCCGNINPAYFRLNNKLFTESQHYNTCLNKKICIDREGNLKNCLYMVESAGTLDALMNGGTVDFGKLKRWWGVRKDDIDVCKDCEFRYMCTDCRSFLKDPADMYSQPEKCPYNPYIGKWEGENGYVAVEKWRAGHPNWEKNAKRKPLVMNPQTVE